MLGVEAEMQEGVVVRIGDHHDVATASPIPTTGPATRNVFFATECEAAIAAISGFNSDFYFVYEHADKRKRPLGGDPAADFG